MRNIEMKRLDPTVIAEKLAPVLGDYVWVANSEDANRLVPVKVSNLLGLLVDSATLTPDARTANFAFETGKIYKCSNAITVTLPLASGVSDGESVVVNMGSDVVTIETTSTDVLNGQAGFESHQLVPGESVRINASGGDWILS